MKSHAKEFGFYFEDVGELLRHYEQGCGVLRFENGCADDNHIKIS